MDPHSHQKFFCIHGHFYQPPRENPLTGWIEQQPSANPHHDWNEKIYEQCYAPNSASRVLDGKAKIKDTVNNYAFMNFNIGPTLFSWLEETHSRTYDRIIEGDGLSCERLDGHGNAIAQVYNHAIMPLASDEDKRLQIRWGIEDFRRRFGREPEGMWLAETAINMNTVVALIREGIKFTVLSPTQAFRVRSLKGEDWVDVSNNSIDTKQAYRIFPTSENGTPLEKGYLDVFFYDMTLSSAVGFEHLLTSASKLGDRINAAFDIHNPESQLVSVCTDGESYGHHEAFGDMCAAYLFHDLSLRMGMIPVSYAWYLAKFPPNFEVKLKNSDTEGTAWSCMHGVGRWCRDCGCSTGGEAKWNQAWRAPLREAMDTVKESADKLLKQKWEKYFSDDEKSKLSASQGWSVNPEVRQQWWNDHLLPGTDAILAFRLLELLKYSQYIYTSCAWFFAEISGIEAMQNLRYAQRCLQILEELEGKSPRPAFLEILSKIKSNVGEKSGETLFIELEEETLPLELYLGLDEWVEARMDSLLSRPKNRLWHCSQKQWWTKAGYELHRFEFIHTISAERRRIALVTAMDWIDTDAIYWSNRMDKEVHDWLELSRHSDDAAIVDLMKNSPLLRLPVTHLPTDVKANLAFQLEKRHWEQSEEAAKHEEGVLAKISIQFNRIRWATPAIVEKRLALARNYNFSHKLNEALNTNEPSDFEAALAIAKDMGKAGLFPDLGPARLKLYPYLRRVGVRLATNPESSDFKSLFLLLDLIDTLDLRSQRYRMENLATPMLGLLYNWTANREKYPEMDIVAAISLLDRLNFSTDILRQRIEGSTRA